MTQELKKLKIRLEKIERELDNCRTSALQDGWQTSKHAKKSRKWDVLAQEKMKLKQRIEELQNGY
jgi:cell division protein FtsB